ncbi:MAG: hypothetical protein ACHQ4H_11910, partial [Ktedonobacterales bacterium]
LAAGASARALAGRALTAGGSAPSATSSPAHHATDTATTSPVGQAPTVVPPFGFLLTAVISPASVAVGQPFTVTVTVVAKDGVTPLAGVACTMQAAPHAAPLLTAWPAPAVSDVTGKAIWSLTAPAAAPGTYTLDISAVGTGGWQADWRPSVTIVG